MWERKTDPNSTQMQERKQVIRFRVSASVQSINREPDSGRERGKMTCSSKIKKEARCEAEKATGEHKTGERKCSIVCRCFLL